MTTPTKAERKRMDAIKEMGVCMACRQMDISAHYVEVHHLNLDGKAGQKRRGHRFTIGLCEWHHRGVMKPIKVFNDQGHVRTYGPSPQDMEMLYGPSLAVNSRKFRLAFGSDDELLEAQDKLLGVTA
jgi:Recombination enhancement, RecA-dependent nuclease